MTRGHCREAPRLSVGCKKIKLICLYYSETFAGGWIIRLNQHFARTKREVEQCRKYPPNICHQMLLKF